jgi:predicted dehydrogenase
MKPLRVGIIGCGNVLDAYRPALARLESTGEATVGWTCGRESQRALALGSFPSARFTVDSSALLAAADLDVVLILTSIPQHAALAAAALQAGRHVVVEKPMAGSLEEARSLLALASRSPGHLVCAPFTLLSPTFQAMARRIRQGDIGRPCSARARYGWSGPSWGDWFYKPGGGCLFDLGVYSITSLTGLLGPVRRVTAMTGVAIPERRIGDATVRVEAEDNAQVLLDFGDSTFAAVTTGFTLQQYRSPALEIYGTTGTIQMLGDDWDPDGYELWQNAAGCWQMFKETAPDWSWTDGLRHLVECVHRGTRPWITPEHAFHVLEIMIRAQESGREGRALAVESRFAPPEFPDATPTEPAHQVHDRSREHSSRGKAS